MERFKNKKFIISSAFAAAVFYTMVVVAFTIHSNSSQNQTRPSAAAVFASETAGPTFTPSIVPKEIVHGNTSRKEVIFTFDGGGSTRSADKILETLAKHQVKGTFFLTGKMIEAHPDLVKRIVAAGHEIFNHTYDHSRLTTLTDDKIEEELAKMEIALRTTANVSTKPYFRAPYGLRDVRVISAAAKAGYQSVFWTVDALDWKELRGKTPQQVKNRILSNVAPGTIYLMHVGDTITGNVLDEVFTTIKSKGYRIVSLTQGL